MCIFIHQNKVILDELVELNFIDYITSRMFKKDGNSMIAILETDKLGQVKIEYERNKGVGIMQTVYFENIEYYVYLYCGTLFFRTNKPVEIRLNEDDGYIEVDGEVVITIKFCWEE